MTRFSEFGGCKTSIAPLQALDVRKPACQRLEVGVFVEQSGDGFGGHGGTKGRLELNILFSFSDSLAKSRSMTLSQTQVLLIAFGILLSGFISWRWRPTWSP